MNKILVPAGLAAALLIGAPMAAQAHHSHAMFDTTKTEEIQGTVKNFNFANPHVYLFLTTMGADGRAVTEPVEMSFVQNMIRQGITTATFKAGDKITVAVNPYRSGQVGGSYRGAIDARGKRYGSLDPTTVVRGPAD